MNKIPLHRISEISQDDIMLLRRVKESDPLHGIHYVHRDDYYIFFLIEKASGKIMIDFEEYEFSKNTVRCILPGQVHFPLGDTVSACGWFLAVDSMLVKDEYKEVFNNISLLKNKPDFNENTLNDLMQCLTILDKKMNSERQNAGKQLVFDLLSSYIGMVAEIYQEGTPKPENKRLAAITYEFRSLLSAHFKTLKRPADYAAKLNLSPVYLNEAVKRTTGLTVSDHIRNEMLIHAKRLLFHTQMSIKEIALELGYEDWAYFTRLFNRATNLSPTQFRKKYLS